MTRVVIATEGEPKSNGMVLKEGSLYWNEVAIPITDYRVEDLLGKATDIRREENGQITAELSIDTEGYDIVLYLCPFQTEKDSELCLGKHTTITNARLRGLTLVPLISNSSERV